MAPKSESNAPSFRQLYFFIPSLDVGTRDVDLDGVDRRVVEDPGNLPTVLDRRTGDIGDEARLGEIEPGQDVVNDAPSARILKPDGVQHSGGGLGDPMRGVAEARGQGGTLEAHGTRIVVRETDHTGILLTETHTTREQYQRGVERKPAEVHRQHPGLLTHHGACPRRSQVVPQAFLQVVLFQPAG